jgi:hypothetical protein
VFRPLKRAGELQRGFAARIVFEKQARLRHD